jgi:hypothetical protein
LIQFDPQYRNQKDNVYHRNSLNSDQKNKKNNQNIDKSMFARLDKDSVEPKDLKLNLSGAKNEMKYSVFDNNKGPNYYEDPRFNKIMEAKKKLNEIKIQNKKKEYLKMKNKENQEIKKKEQIEKRITDQKREKAELKLQEMLEQKRKRDQILKSSLSYKFLKDTIPLFKQIEKKVEQSRNIKIKPNQKNHRVPLKDILTHSRIIKTKQLEKQKERYY